MPRLFIMVRLIVDNTEAARTLRSPVAVTRMAPLSTTDAHLYSLWFSASGMFAEVAASRRAPQYRLVGTRRLRA